MKKKVLSLVLALVIIGIFSTSAFAETATGSFVQVDGSFYGSNISVSFNGPSVTFAQLYLYKDGVSLGTQYIDKVNSGNIGFSNLAPANYTYTFISLFGGGYLNYNISTN